MGHRRLIFVPSTDTVYVSIIFWLHLNSDKSVIFFHIKPTLVMGIVPKAKKYVFFPIEANKFPK